MGTLSRRLLSPQFAVAIEVTLSSRQLGCIVWSCFQAVLAIFLALEGQNCCVFSAQKIVKIIIGEPKSLDGSFTDSTKVIHNFHKKITKLYSKIKVELYDERFTSKIAKHILFSSDLKKNKRKNKEYLDKISAVIILQDYLKSEGLS